MVLLELDKHGAVEELDIFVIELGERCGSRRDGGRGSKRGGVAEDRGTGSEGCTALEEGSTVGLGHCEILLCGRG